MPIFCDFWWLLCNSLQNEERNMKKDLKYALERRIRELEEEVSTTPRDDDIRKQTINHYKKEYKTRFGEYER